MVKMAMVNIIIMIPKARADVPYNVLAKKLMMILMVNIMMY